MGYMRMGRCKVKPDMIDEFLTIYQTQAIPVIKMAPGNVAAFVLQQISEPDNFNACTIWATREDAENYDQSGAATEMAGKIRHTLNGPPALLV